jgi:alpha-ketoglutarate-dependent taurine dioxygenase
MEGMKQSYITKEKFPLVIESQNKEEYLSKEQFYNFLEKNKENILNSLLKVGAILFRGFALTTASDFNKAVASLGFGTFLNYAGGDSPRDKVEGRIYTSTEAPPSLKIPLHQEMSFIKYFPRHIYFFCEHPPLEGGQTIIADGRKIYQDMDEKIKGRFSSHQLKYVSHYWGSSPVFSLMHKWTRGHKSWMEAFESNSQEEVESFCQKNEFLCKWHRRSSWLEVNQICSPIINHPVTRERVWFNQAHLYDYNPRLIGKLNYLGTKLLYARKHTKMHEIYFEDNNPVERKDLYAIMDVLDKNTVAFNWQKGDFLVLDNVLAMHGRAPFKGKRRILTALTR